MKVSKLLYLLFLLTFSYSGNSQCNSNLDSNSMLKDSIDQTFLPYYLELANEKISDFEITLTLSGEICGDDLYRIYCKNGTLRVRLYRHSFYFDTAIKETKFKFDTAIQMKFKNISGQNFIDSLAYYNFFTLKNMDSTMKIKQDTLENGSIRISEYDVVNIACNKTNYSFEYIIRDKTRSYYYEGLKGFLILIPDRIEFQQANKIVEFFFNNIEQIP